MVNTPIHTISKKCQNILKRINRDRTGVVNPLATTWPIMTTIQIRPPAT
jgi:hypothetical protein